MMDAKVYEILITFPISGSIFLIEVIVFLLIRRKRGDNILPNWKLKNAEITQQFEVTDVKPDYKDFYSSYGAKKEDDEEGDKSTIEMQDQRNSKNSMTGFNTGLIPESESGQPEHTTTTARLMTECKATTPKFS